MKLLILSDIHGSCYYAQKIPEIVKREKPDKIVLLGDLFYPSGKNILPGEFDPQKVAFILNQYQDKMIAVRGNCDSKADEMLCSFEIQPNVWLEWEGLDVFLTHGNYYHRNHLPKHRVDIFIFGHLHEGFVEKEEGIVFANSGSLSVPRNGSTNSYLILEKDEIVLKHIDGNILKSQKI